MGNQPIRQERSALARRLRRWDGAALLGVVAILLIVAGMLIAQHGGQPNLNPGLGPEPQRFLWAEQATLNSQTPQQAYAAAMRLTPCIGAPSATPGLGGPPRSSSVTWIVATHNYGLAHIEATCDPPARTYRLWLFEIFRIPAQGWRPQGGVIASNWSANPDVTPTPTPTWLSLPHDTYNYFQIEQPGIAEYPEVGVVEWDAQQRLFIFGHIADQAIRPANASSVVVDHLPGWMTTENGLVTITVGRADGTTLFFSGTAAPSVIQSLAAQAFAHADEALQPLQPTATTPSAMSERGG